MNVWEDVTCGKAQVSTQAREQVHQGPLVRVRVRVRLRVRVRDRVRVRVRVRVRRLGEAAVELGREAH